MLERERIVTSGLVAFMLILWLGFAVHRSPRFPGSFVGSALGIAAAGVMLMPLAYLVVKRVRGLRAIVTARISMRTLLSWHIYAGIVGPILALVHTAHRFQSPLGVALTATMLVVVLSGFVGRHLLSRISREIHEKKALLNALEERYRQTAGEIALRPASVPALNPLAAFIPRALALFFVSSIGPSAEGIEASARAIAVAESIADVEYAIATHELAKAAFSRWLRWHIAISALLYALLATHVGAEVYLGLRWLR